MAVKRKVAGRWPWGFLFKEIDAPTLAGCALLFFSLIAGGGGSPAELSELAVQLAALVAIFALIISKSWAEVMPRAVVRRDWVIASLWLLLILLMLMQIVPMPFDLWSKLPGREAISINASAGGQAPMLPMSIAPARTIGSLLAVIPPLVAYVLASAGRTKFRDLFLQTFLLFGIFSISLQLIQLSGEFFLYDRSSTGYTVGFQANRNSQGDILVLLLLAVAIRPRYGQARSAFALQQFVLAFIISAALLGTWSRAALLLAIFPMALLILRELRVSAHLGARHIYVTVCAALIGATALYFSGNPVLFRVLDRFELGSNGRAELVWPDAWYAAQQFFPVGSGIGTFIPAFQMFESQEVVTPKIANRAHNEVLEILIEAGGFGLGLAAIALIVILWRAATVVRRGDSSARRRATFLIFMTIVLGLHSMVDYPLRSMSIAVLYSAMLGCVVADRRRISANERTI